MHRVVVDVAKNQDWPAPSYATVYAVVRDIDPAMRTLALDGEKRYREVFDLIHRREAARPNEIWQADHTELDLWVIAPSGKPARPWLTVIEDDHSRAIAGYAVNLGAPSAIQTALALRQAIWRKSEPGWHVCGIPATFYTDHGSDFTSLHMEQVAADLKIRLVFSQPGKPRGRGKIERYFATINQMCLPALPGYAPRGTKDRAGQARLASLSSTRRSAGSSSRSTTRQPHSETASRRRPAGTPSGSCRTCRSSLEQLDLLLLTIAKPRKVHPDGIHLFGIALPRHHGARRVRRRTGHRSLRPARCRRDPRVPRRPVPVPGDLPRVGRADHRHQGDLRRPQRPPAQPGARD